MTPPHAIGQELRLALRRLRKSPGFTAVAVLCLGVGVGAATAMFAFINALFLRPLPGIEEPDRLVTLHLEGPSSYPNYQDLREGNQVLAGVAALADNLVGVRTGDAVERVAGLLVSANYFEILGTRPAVGRFFSPEEERSSGASPVAVISHSFWQRRFGEDPAAVGSTIHVNGTAVTVVGVAPPGFLGTFVGFRFDIWLPFSLASVARPSMDPASRGSDHVELIGRLAPGVNLAQARAELEVAARRLEEAFPAVNRGLRIEARQHTGFDESVRRPVLALAGALLAIALLVLLIACFNVANMLLTRSVARAKEASIRHALGAGRLRLLGSMLTESLILGLLGGSLGLILSVWAARTLEGFWPTLPVPLALDLGPDWRVVLFGLLVSGLTALAAGALPAARSARPDAVAGLKVAGPDPGGRSRLRHAFVVAQVAGSAVLLVCAGLFVRTLAAAARLDYGFAIEPIRVAPVLDPSMLGLDMGEARRLYGAITLRVAAVPGVAAASTTSAIPLVGASSMSIVVPGAEPDPGGEAIQVDFAVVTPGYFETLGTSLLEGRDFGDADRLDGPRVAIVNESMARRLWPGREALGRRLEQGGEPVEVVGVAPDSRQRALERGIRPTLYLPFAQAPRPRMNLLVRVAGAEATLAGPIRRALSEVHPDLALLRLQPLRDLLGLRLLGQRLAASVGGTLGLLGLALAVLGLYGVVAFSVSRRTRELGIRMALGAARGRVLGLVVGEGLWLALVGLAIGLPLAIVVARLLRSLLFGVAPTDPLTFGGVALLLIGCALLGSYLPARRAARVDPMVALRFE